MSSKRKKSGFTYYFNGLRAVVDECVYRMQTVIESKRRYFAALSKQGFKRTFILCYPEKPESLHSLYAICHSLGLIVTNNPREKAAAVMHFEDVTLREHNPVLAEIAKHRHVINARCNDIGKEHVEKIFQKVFGYGMKVDPRTHVGACVRKSNDNAVHDGVVVACPTEPEKEYLYQKLVNNQEDDMVVDIRLSIFNDKIPLAYLRYKKLDDRFDNTIRSVRVPVESIITEDEARKVIRFCKEFGLEYGELDTLRDKDDGKLYIVDANNTPWGPRPSYHVSPAEYEIFLKTASAAFASEFMK